MVECCLCWGIFPSWCFPAIFCCTELPAILQAQKLAGNQTSYAVAHELKDLVGASPTRPSVYMEAPVMRATCRTSIGYEDMHLRLAEKAKECSNLASALSSIIPPGWDSPAFCSNLYFAPLFDCLKYAPGSKHAHEWRVKGGLFFHKRVYDVFSMPSHDLWPPRIDSPFLGFGIDGWPLSQWQCQDSVAV